MAASLLIRATDPPVARLAVPRVWAVADDRLPRLEWRAELDHHTDATWECLADFVKLSSADILTVEMFARRWGVLGVDADGRPGPPPGSAPVATFFRLAGQHRDQIRELVDDVDGAYRASVTEWWEPLVAWHHAASRVRAILHLAADRQDQRGSDTGDVRAAIALPTGIISWLDHHDWEIGPDPDLDGAERSRVRPVRGEVGETRRDQVLEFATKALLEPFTFRVRFTVPTEGPPRLEAGLTDAGEAAVTDDETGFPRDWAAYVYPGPSLYATLVLQLVAAVWWPLGLVRCSWCGNPFPRSAERAPRRDRAVFCSSSCRTAAKMANDRERARQRYARRGSTADDPAQQ